MYSVDDHSTIGSGVDMVMLSVESGPSPCCHFCFRVAYHQRISIDPCASWFLLFCGLQTYACHVFTRTLQKLPVLGWINGSVVEDFNVLLT